MGCGGAALGKNVCRQVRCQIPKSVIIQVICIGTTEEADHVIKDVTASTWARLLEQL
ncbi:hypothetical protein LguiB_021406 [Lonicera macranthoides]